MIIFGRNNKSQALSFALKGEKKEEKSMFSKNADESNCKSSEKGFTLIEIMIALAIFSVGILGVASMQILSVNYNIHARRTSEATTCGVERMETLMTFPYDDANLDPATNPHTDARGIYNITWNITDNTDNKTINMTVSWTVKGATRNVQLNYVKPKNI